MALALLDVPRNALNLSGKNMTITSPPATESAGTSSSTTAPGNVGPNERWLSAAGGAVLALFGLKRRSALGLAAAALGAGLIKRGVTGQCGLYRALGIDAARSKDQPASPKAYFERSEQVCAEVTVRRPAEELYSFWRDLSRLPEIMSHLKRVEVLDDRRSRWTATGLAGEAITWDAEIINDQRGRLIAWRSLAGADVDCAGSVRFLPTDDGLATTIKIAMDYIPPAGRVGAAAARLFGRDAGQQIQSDLERFRDHMDSLSPNAVR